MRVKFAKWGNSLAIRIPAAFAAEIGAKENASAELSLAGGKLVLAPVRRIPSFDLDELVGRITDANRHEEAPTGRAWRRIRLMRAPAAAVLSGYG